ncbi:unnamed protein product [Colletotrichum noveboracense]|uniref:Uncharacterized protein n=1 Tax=Colletotrichum noveboracense TaxID=2664923 RepID=A0A9W4WQP4_9PEZI|nr:unnamed protein product [Colletotrichum noveboracense]
MLWYCESHLLVVYNLDFHFAEHQKRRDQDRALGQQLARTLSSPTPERKPVVLDAGADQPSLRVVVGCFGRRLLFYVCVRMPADRPTHRIVRVGKEPFRPESIDVLWDWYTIFKRSRGLLRQLTSRSPSSLHKMGIDYHLREANKWVADACWSWVEQATSEDEVLKMRLPILAHAIAIDAAMLYMGFCAKVVYDRLHRDFVMEALRRQRVVPTAYGIAVVSSQVYKIAKTTQDHTPQHY